MFDVCGRRDAAHALAYCSQMDEPALLLNYKKQFGKGYTTLLLWKAKETVGKHCGRVRAAGAQYAEEWKRRRTQVCGGCSWKSLPTLTLEFGTQLRAAVVLERKKAVL